VRHDAPAWTVEGMEGGMTTPAELDRLLRSQRKPEYDKDGKCLHTRSYYDTTVRRHVCPDCHDIDWRGEWKR